MKVSVKRAVAAALSAFCALVFMTPRPARALPGTVLWDAVYSSRPGLDSDHAKGLAIDSMGNLLVTGYVTTREGNHDYLTVKYGPYGSTEWVRIFDSSWYDVGTAVTADVTGGVIVAGASYNPDNPRDSYSRSYYTDYHIIKYDPFGEPLVEMTSSGNKKNNEPAGVAADSDGGIYVTGSAKNVPDTYSQYYTVKFEPAGRVLWERVENWDEDAYATGIKIDKDGSVLVTGYVKNPAHDSYDIRTTRVTPDGNKLLMDLVYDNKGEDEKAWGITLDATGNVIITGESSDSGGITLTMKYSPSGELLWSERYRGSEYKNHGASVAVDAYGRTYVAGKVTREEGAGDYLLLIYDKDGMLIDDKVYPFGGDSGAAGVALDAYGNIVVAGTTRLPDQPAVFRTIRLEGYPTPRAKWLAPDKVFDHDKRIALIFPAMPMIRKVALTVEKTDPRSGDSPLVFVADPSGMPGEYEYRFLVMGRNNAHHWEAVTEYSDSNFWVMKPTPKDFEAKVMVQVRAKGSGLQYEASEALDIGQVK